MRSAVFLPMPLIFGKRARCRWPPRCLESRHARAAEHVERGLRADAADVVDEQAEKIALRRGHEAEEDVRVFADLEVS